MQILYCRKEEERISSRKYADYVLLKGRRKDIKEKVRRIGTVERKKNRYHGGSNQILYTVERKKRISRRKYADYVL
jgi:hypothetical protein